MAEDDFSQDDSIEGTRVDLGDDLLEKTAIIPGVPAPLAPQNPADLVPENTTEEKSKPFDVADSMQTADILLGEGLVDEAKKIYRLVLTKDPSNVAVRLKLAEILEIELKDIFSDTRPRRRYRQKTSEDLLNVKAESIMQGLDRDLDLGLFDYVGSGGIRATELSLFDDREALAKYAEKVENEISGVSGQDRIDLGVAFLEMGLFELATIQFRHARRLSQERSSPNIQHSLVATCLLGYTLIQQGRSFETISELEPYTRESELQEGEKVDLFYLMGRAHEKLGNEDVAQFWYRQVYGVDAVYRDVQDRLKKR